MRSSLFIVYSAAAISFGAGLVRDWMVVHHVASSKEFFGAMYAIAFASSFAVNEMSFRAGHSPLRAREFSVIAASSVLCVALLWTSGLRSPAVLALAVPMPALYIVGAYLSRTLIDEGMLFVSRSRDSLTSIFMAACIASGFGLGALLLATLLATICFAAVLKGRRSAPPIVTGDDRAPPVRAEAGRKAWLRSMVYSNVAISLVTLWALFTNNHGTTAFGQSAPVVVRFSLYAFQILSIPAVLVLRVNVPGEHAGVLRISAWLGVVCLCGSALLPLAVASIAIPVAAVATMYTSLLYLRAEHAQVSAAS